MISVLVSSLIDSPSKWELLRKCTDSLKGYDELIVLSSSGSLGYCGSWNKLAEMAKGDFLIFMSDDQEVLSGELKDLCIENTVTSPSGSNMGEGEFWGGFFCMPRNIYEEIGLYDMIYNDGIHYMDEDLKERILKAGFNLKRVKNVEALHTHPGLTLNKVEFFNDKTSRNHSIFDSRWR